MKKKEYIATFVGYGLKRHRSRTPKTIALYKDLRIQNGKYINPRAWSNATKKITQLKLQPGDKITFQAQKVEKHTQTHPTTYKITGIAQPHKKK